ncbi:unnamed protein product [Closterium sp. NIES-54]
MLPKAVTAEQLTAVFSQYGTVIDINVLKPAPHITRGAHAAVAVAVAAAAAAAAAAVAAASAAAAAPFLLHSSHGLAGSTLPQRVREMLYGAAHPVTPLMTYTVLLLPSLPPPPPPPSPSLPLLPLFLRVSPSAPSLPNPTVQGRRL